ncbi:MAG: hypothetical protein IT291_07970 [Deltaproteobacteria bacterium]|nr:hypothetical protein [Deltaproteobacteria bacterium]
MIITKSYTLVYNIVVRQFCCQQATVWFVLLSALLFVGACGGGGNSGGGGGSSQRSNETAIRIVHGGIDVTPMALYYGEGDKTRYVQTARYAESTRYVPVDAADQVLISLERANSPGVGRYEFRTNLAKGVEYTALVYGEVRGKGVNVGIREDVVQRPEEGTAFLSLFNSYIGTASINVTAGSSLLGSVKFGEFLPITALASGMSEVSVNDAQGVKIAALSLNMPDRGEVLLHLTGSKDLGVVFAVPLVDYD